MSTDNARHAAEAREKDGQMVRLEEQVRALSATTSGGPAVLHSSWSDLLHHSPAVRRRSQWCSKARCTMEAPKTYQDSLTGFKTTSSSTLNIFR